MRIWTSCAAVVLLLAPGPAAAAQAPPRETAPQPAAPPSPPAAAPGSPAGNEAAPGATAGSGAGPAAAPVFFETATVQARPLSSATASVSVLDRRDIDRSGARTVGELMRFIPGVDLLSNGARGGLTLAEIRGGDEKSLVLIDGVPVDDP